MGDPSSRSANVGRSAAAERPCGVDRGPYDAVMSATVDDIIQRSAHWSDAMARLRPVLLGAGLAEEVKWNKPCYSYDGANICIMQEMKDFLALMFFKGALFDDPDGVLASQGPNSRSAKRIELTSVDEVVRLEGTIAAYVDLAIEAEEAGLAPEPVELELVAELQDRLDADDELAEAFFELTPGRRREYNLHIGGAKKSETRASRVDACVPRILAGKGLRDR